MPIATTELPRLRIALGVDAPACFDPGLPVLAGQLVENLFGVTRPAGRSGNLALFDWEGWLLGAATVPLAPGLEPAAHQIYADILRAAQGRHLARVWNYVPAINAPGPGGLENYRLFSRGRSLAFEEHHGSGFKTQLPAASAVGTRSGTLTVAFAASPGPVGHVENPLQVPAYDYPPEYGPRAPSFSRATVIPGAKHGTVFISGTAAVRGHASVAPDSLPRQLECTLGNLEAISEACGLGPRLGQGGGATRHFKVYLRHASDQSLVAATLERRLLTNADHVSYLQADLCRPPLLVEIEASLFGVALAGSAR